jgi:bifunctional DNA-binding transcriptional regulator/antitoxin component of YhaV-PrlF toxin-antitoxin module
MTLTAKGQFTLNKQLLEHLRVKPGEKVLINKLPDGSLSVRAENNLLNIDSLRGIIKTDINLSDEEIQESIAQSYIQRGMSGI